MSFTPTFPVLTYCSSDIRRRQLDLYQGLPACLIYQVGREVGEDVLCRQIQLFIKLEHLLNLFVAGRLMQRRGHRDSGELLATSFELVSLTLLFWKNKDKFSAIDLPGLVSREIPCITQLNH